MCVVCKNVKFIFLYWLIVLIDWIDWSDLLYCNLQHYTALPSTTKKLHCIKLQCSALHSSALYCTPEGSLSVMGIFWYLSACAVIFFTRLLWTHFLLFEPETLTWYLILQQTTVAYIIDICILTCFSILDKY